MDMKTPLDADKVKAVIDAAATEKLAELARLGEHLRGEVDEYIRNAEFVQANVGQLFADAAFFAVKEVDLGDDYGYRNDTPTFDIGGIELRLEGVSGHSTRSLPLRASYHASGERESPIAVAKGRYRVVLALMPVKE